MSDRLGGRGDWMKYGHVYHMRYRLRDQAMDALWPGESPPRRELAVADAEDLLGASLRASLRFIDPSDPM